MSIESPKKSTVHSSEESARNFLQTLEAQLVEHEKQYTAALLAKEAAMTAHGPDSKEAKDAEKTVRALFDLTCEFANDIAKLKTEISKPH